VAVGIVTAGVYLLGQLIQLIADHWPQIVGGITVLGLILAALSRAGICPGLHCPGCRH
jgi:NADH:ubiquinone oxidoreductase subunit 5 (subunit L)/multisubunit Na+/H+ antiporter MnhA subunit